MKKTFIIFTLLLCALMFTRAINTSCSVENGLVGYTWKFKAVASEDLFSTAEYMAVLYDASEYKFSDDHTYTSVFQGMETSGNWEVSADNNLVLNKGTIKEETYKLSFPTDHSFVLHGTEKETEVYIEFEGN
jgi:hypothetical protein